MEDVIVIWYGRERELMSGRVVHFKDSVFASGMVESCCCCFIFVLDVLKEVIEQNEILGAELVERLEDTVKRLNDAANEITFVVDTGRESGLRLCNFEDCFVYIDEGGQVSKHGGQGTIHPGNL